jgi:hypothetical protein
MSSQPEARSGETLYLPLPLLPVFAAASSFVKGTASKPVLSVVEWMPQVICLQCRFSR